MGARAGADVGAWAEDDMEHADEGALSPVPKLSLVLRRRKKARTVRFLVFFATGTNTAGSDPRLRIRRSASAGTMKS